MRYCGFNGEGPSCLLTVARRRSMPHINVAFVCLYLRSPCLALNGETTRPPGDLLSKTTVFVLDKEGR